METKLIAAEIATSAGVATIVTTSKKPENMFHIIEYTLATARQQQASTVASPALSSPGTPGEPSNPPPDPNPNNPHEPTLTRPPHTLFLASTSPLSDLKAWTSHTLTPAGSVVVDPGAYRVLSRRDSGGRLLPAGVLAVHGQFASGQAVRILIRKNPTASVEATYQSIDTAAEILDSLPDSPGDGGRSSGVSPEVTRPSTPRLIPSSMTSSVISSIDPITITRQASIGSIIEAQVTQTQAQRSMLGSSLQGIDEQTGSMTITPSAAADTSDAEWEHVEVGRGLANYNSDEIRKVKGDKR